MNSSNAHETVLLQQAVDALDITADSVIVDCTFGRGGHSQLILDSLGPNGRLIAFDKDPEAIEFAEKRFAKDQRFKIVHKSFAEIQQVIEQLQLAHKVDGILLDLGVSSPQLDNAERGFSFMHDGPLDMRMNPEQGISAAQWLARAKESDIKYVLKVYGEEKFAGRIARKIIELREEQPIVTTKQLAKLIEEVVPTRREQKRHPATRSFQAIRIYINEELSDLERALTGAFEVLSENGHIVVISFHSLEDRIVKRYFKSLAKADDYPKDLPVMASQIKPKAIVKGKPIKPEVNEVSENIRSRSAIMRTVKKL
ncbi:MAG: 16S rRNA (cytosine(1402)-N(4))-methyltransferase RsmH [Kangiellaceae bacterium]|jgi:16S rRNA (cytosine1402-N4)-methyltransferase|nr:16S rRNA (cytosine(1402)-N(4))-methyltransferase RsmH [Kangiellaceae bacterium]